MKKLAFLFIAVSVLLYTPVRQTKAVADLTAFNAYMTFAEWMEYCLANGLELDFSDYTGTADQFFEDVIGITNTVNDPFRALGKIFRTGSATEELFYRDMYSKIYQQFTTPQYIVNDNKLRGTGYSFSTPTGYQDVLEQLRLSGVSFDFNGNFLENLSKRLNISRQALALSLASDTTSDPTANVSAQARLYSTYLYSWREYCSAYSQSAMYNTIAFGQGLYPEFSEWNHSSLYGVWDLSKPFYTIGSAGSDAYIRGSNDPIALFYNTTTNSASFMSYYNGTWNFNSKLWSYGSNFRGHPSNKNYSTPFAIMGNLGSLSLSYNWQSYLNILPYTLRNTVDFTETLKYDLTGSLDTVLSRLVGRFNMLQVFVGPDIGSSLPVLNYGDSSNPWSVTNESGLAIDVPSADGNTVPIDNIYVPTVDGSIDNDSAFSLDIAGLLQKIADAIDSKSKVTYQDIADTITDTETGTVAHTTTVTTPATATQTLDVPIADVGESNLILPSFDSPMAQTFTGGMSVLALIVSSVQTALGPLTYVFWFGVILCIVALVVKRFLE